MDNSLILSLNNKILNAYNSKQLVITDELIYNYARQLQITVSSKETYLHNINNFRSWLSANNIAFITDETLIDYRCYLLANYKGNAANSYIASIKSLFNYLETQGYINYARSLKLVKVDQTIKAKDNLTIDQVINIYSNLKCDSEQEARTRALMMLLIGTGLRSIEVVNANIDSIQTRGNVKVLLIQGKGYNNARDNISSYVILQPLIMNAIQDYLRFRPGAKDNEPLFTSLSNRNHQERLTTRTIRNLVKGVYKDNGIISERITTHSTRHTAITLSLLSGATIQETQQLARHKNINTTMIYAHNLNRLVNNAESKIDTMLTNAMKGGING